MVGGLGSGGTSAMAEPGGVPTLRTSFPSNPTTSVLFQSWQYIGGYRREAVSVERYDRARERAPKCITNAVLSGSYLYVLSAPENDMEVILRFDQ
ncbi:MULTISPECIES: hypothetical protein [unclassified Cryobacterium]|uniref:hypothetical protein n=1 Tax=unclassified Cryobacterium TaxID=2649013 RepID=UPI0011250DDD|nr:MULTISPECIES: hypothetical protein [unclassified Cryobacterium]